jgi:hypothetical protein
LFEEVLQRSATTLAPGNPYRLEWTRQAAAFFEATGHHERAAELADLIRENGGRPGEQASLSPVQESDGTFP